MIVCLCKGINEETILEKCNKYSTYQEIKDNTNAGTGCGICLPYIEQMLKDQNETKIR